jgi:hypothetical protein
MNRLHISCCFFLLSALACSSTKSSSATDGSTPGSGGKAAAGTGGAGPGSGGGAGGTAGAPTASNSVLERNNHPSRDGHFVQPTLTKALAATMDLDVGFNAAFTGSTWASPLYLENGGPGGKGLFFAVTYGNDVFALDETTGAIVWQKNIGTPATGPIGCNATTFASLGILSTPVIDARSGTIYIAGAIGTAQGITADIVTALSVADGSTRAGWPVDVSTTLAFDPKVHIQRSALSLVNGILYVGYGGFVGDCGPYHGRVVAINVANPTQLAGWASGGQGEGIWAPGGFASDGNGVFAITGNHTPRSDDAGRVDSEQVMRITGMATLAKADPKNFFYPSTWSAMDLSDADFGTNSPVYLQVPGATPTSILATVTKDGHLFLLDPANLGGGSGRPVADFTLSTGPMSIHTVPAGYATAQGARLTLSTDSGAVCPTGAGGRVVMAVALSAASPPVPTTLWCAPITGGPMAPMATTTDGKSNALVWIMNGTQLNAFDGESGAAVFAGGTGTCTGVLKWTTPIAVKGRIVVAGNGHLCSWSAH